MSKKKTASRSTGTVVLCAVIVVIAFVLGSVVTRGLEHSDGRCRMISAGHPRTCLFCDRAPARTAPQPAPAYHDPVAHAAPSNQQFRRDLLPPLVYDSPEEIYASIQRRNARYRQVVQAYGGQY